MNKMRKMLEVWGDAQVVVHLDFIDGSAVEGLVKEIDRDEVVLEPVYDDGSFGPLTVVNLNHVMMAYYDESPPDLAEDADAATETAAASSTTELVGEPTPAAPIGAPTAGATAPTPGVSATEP